MQKLHQALTFLTFLAISTFALADGESDLSHLPPPPSTVDDYIKIKSLPEGPTIRAPLSSDTPNDPFPPPGAENPAPPSDAPTYPEMNPRTEPFPSVPEILD